ncbi:MAG: hypothetical protein ACRC1W_13270 [Shewanella sp.]
MNRFLLSVVAVLLLLVSGCSLKVAPATSTEVKDSTYVKETVRFDTLRIPGETIRVIEEHFIECDSITLKAKLKHKKYKGGRSSLIISIDKNGTLQATSHCDSIEKILKLKDTEITRLRSEKKTETIVKITHEPRWYDIALRWVAVILTLVFIIRLKIS